MTTDKQKEHEKKYFETYKQYDGEIPKGDDVKIEFGDKPDVIITKGESRLVGIEIADLYLQCGGKRESEQVQKNYRIEVIQAAQKQYLNAGEKRITLTVSFNLSKPIEKKNINKISTELSKFAKTIENNELGGIHVGPSSKFGEISPEIDWLYLEDRNGEWKDGSSFDVPRQLSIDMIQKIINSKTKKLVDYKSCDKYWLLLVVDFMNLAQDQEFNWPEGAYLEKAEFERVIIFKFFNTQSGQIVVV